MTSVPARQGPDEVEFYTVLRGYDRTAVDTVLAGARQAARSEDPAVREAAARELREVDFP